MMRLRILITLVRKFGIFIAIGVYIFLQAPGVSAQPTLTSPPNNEDSQAIYNDWVNYVGNAKSPQSTGSTTPTNPIIPQCGVTSASESLPASFPTDYATVFDQAAAAYNINPNFLAAIFITENGNVIKPFNTDWAALANSGTGAEGPFQFEPGTWGAYAVDGNNDGVKDVFNIWDAAFSAANMMKQNGVTPGTTVGNLTTPYVPGTFTYFAAAYNAGGGAVQEYTTPTSSLDSILSGGSGYQQTVTYVTNVYDLLNSGLTNGDPSYGGNNGVVVNQDTSSGTTSSSTGSGSTTQASTACNAQTSIVSTALEFAWPTPPTVAPTRDPLTPEPAYAAYISEFYPGAPSAGADCGTFVGAVMHFSGADPNYPEVGTMAQQDYVEANPQLYTVITNATSTAQLQPGDILIVNQGDGTGANGHTFIWVGPQGTAGYNEASASEGDRMPNLDYAPANLVDPLGRGTFIVARLIAPANG